MKSSKSTTDPQRLNNLKTALIYDKVNTFGGAERVLLALHQLFPRAPLYTSVYHPNRATWAKVFPQVIPSFIQKLPFARTHPQWYTSLMPLAFETLSFDQYDLVISVTSSEAKGIITKPETLHPCYCLTPPRYLWVDPGYSSYRHFWPFSFFVHSAKSPLLSHLRSWDQVAASRPDAYATTSQTVAQRIQKYYRRNAQVIHPPVDTDFFQPAKLKKPQGLNSISTHTNMDSTPGVNRDQGYFLLVSRLVPYKKIDLAIQAFQQLDLPLKIIGTGPELPRLKRLCRNMINHVPTVGTCHASASFDEGAFLLGHVSEPQLLHLYQHCRALIMPQEEDFGLVAIEAMACGKPVIAYQKGGATETVIENKTGLFFDHQTPQSLIQAIKKFQSQKFSSQACRHQALKFSLDKFQTQMRQWISSQVKEHNRDLTQHSKKLKS